VADQERQGRQEVKELRVLLVLRVGKALPDFKVNKDRRAFKDLPARQVREEPRELLVIQVLLVRRGGTEIQVRQGNKALQVTQGSQAEQETRAR
jgi:hypothetical protein